jgi:hypothetical protein
MRGKLTVDLDKNLVDLSFELMLGPLLQMLRSGDTPLHDAAAFTIQNLLQLCKADTSSAAKVDDDTLAYNQQATADRHCTYVIDNLCIICTGSS